MRRRNPGSEEEALYGGNQIERMKFRVDHWNRDPYEPSATQYSYDQFKPDPAGEFITSNLWTGSDYSGSLVEKSNQKELLEQFGKLPGVHELYGDMGTYGLVFHVPTVMTWDESPRTALIDMLKGLENYPLIDEEAHSMMEFEAQQEAWSDWAASDFKRELEKSAELYDLEVLDDDAFLRFFEQVRDRANVYWETETGGNVYIDLKRIADKVTDKDLGLLIRDKVISVTFDDDDERTPEEYLALVPPRDVPGQLKMFGANPRRRELSVDELAYTWGEDRDGEYIQMNDRAGTTYVAHGRPMETISVKPFDFKTAKRWMRDKGIFLNIWYVNDHGNVELYNASGRSLGGLV
jgi:hypothetical protein